MEVAVSVPGHERDAGGVVAEDVASERVRAEYSGEVLLRREDLGADPPPSQRASDGGSAGRYPVRLDAHREASDERPVLIAHQVRVRAAEPLPQDRVGGGEGVHHAVVVRVERAPYMEFCLFERGSLDFYLFRHIVLTGKVPVPKRGGDPRLVFPLCQPYVSAGGIDLQRGLAPHGSRSLLKMEPTVGIKPTAFSLPMRCSITELCRQDKYPQFRATLRPVRQGYSTRDTTGTTSCFRETARISNCLPREAMQNSIPVPFGEYIRNNTRLKFGGETEIRTRGSLRISCFQDKRVKPLRHLSMFEVFVFT